MDNTSEHAAYDANVKEGKSLGRTRQAKARKVRFTLVEEECCSYYVVSARRKTTGKFERIGVCHPAARADVSNGKYELIQWD
jgi:hypothetical protein